MTECKPSTAVLIAFNRWKRAELAAYFAQPCPDDVMDDLTEESNAATRALADVPARNAVDVLLKLLPLTLIINDVPYGRPPLLPVNEPEPGTDYQEDAFWRSLIVDLRAVCPILAQAMATPPSKHATDTAAEWAARPGGEA